MAKLSLSRAWEETKSVLSHDGKLITSVALALILFPQALGWVANPPPGVSSHTPAGWAPLLSLLITLAGLAGEIAIMRLSIGPATSVGSAIRRGGNRVIPSFFAFVLFGLALMLLALPLLVLTLSTEQMEAFIRGARDPEVMRMFGLIFLLVIFLAARFQLMLPVASVEPGGPIRLLKRSYELSAGYYFKLLGFLLVALLAGVIIWYASLTVAGTVARVVSLEIAPWSVGALLVGLFVAAAQTVFSAIFSVMLARIYLQLAGPAHADVSVPSSGT